jgi:hypothetical protein
MIEIPLSSRKYPGLVAQISDGDAEMVAGYTWHPKKHDKTFYAVAYASGTGGKSVFMHRLVMSTPEGVETDHIDRDGLNNQRSNLRLATRSQNGANRGRRINNTTGYIGVHRSGRKYRARIKIDGMQLHLGYFDDPADAARAYDNAARQAFGEYAVCNFPAL